MNPILLLFLKNKISKISTVIFTSIYTSLSTSRILSDGAQSIRISLTKLVLDFVPF